MDKIQIQKYMIKRDCQENGHCITIKSRRYNFGVFDHTACYNFILKALGKSS